MISERILVRIITDIAYIWRIVVVLLVFPPKITEMSPKIHTA